MSKQDDERYRRALLLSYLLVCVPEIIPEAPPKGAGWVTLGEGNF
jgi:hypothetical protein